MYKLFVIAKNNIKKQKGDMITFLILTFISAFLIFDCASAVTGIGHVLQDVFDDVNGAHVMLISGDTKEENDAAKKAFENNENIIEYEKTPCLNMVGKYRKKGEKEFMDYTFFVASFDSDCEMLNIKKPVDSLSKDEILLPRNMKSAYDIGDVIEIKLDDEVYSYKVAGYIEDPYFCSTINITVYSVIVSDEAYKELEDDDSRLVVSTMMYKGRVSEQKLADKTIRTDKIENEINEEYKEGIKKAAEENPQGNYSYLLVNWQMMKGGSAFMPYMVMAVMLVFAILVLAIAIIIISFSVKNFIRKNMKNTGILEASGYTVSELRWTLILQLMLVGMIGSALGVLAGVMTFEKFGDVMGGVVGLSWSRPVCANTLIFTLLGIAVLLFIVASSLSRVYKKISVLDALRGGLSTHNFKKNYFPFETTPLPIPLTMALKDTFGGLRRNIAMMIVFVVLSVSMLAGFGLYNNFGKDSMKMMEMFGMEFTTAAVADNDNDSDYKKISGYLKDLDSVKSVLTISEFEPVIKKGDKEETVHAYAYDDPENSINIFLVEGRLPKKDNEIIVTSGVADDLELGVGDVVTVKYADEEADYLIVGINQRMERMGRTIIMTTKGAKKIVGKGLSYHYNVTAKEGKGFDDVKKEIDKLEDEKDLDFSESDYVKMMESTTTSVTMAMKMLCSIIVVLTILIVIFVESLVIRSKISRDWKSMGIFKALGQTGGNLITQIMVSNMPAILTGTVIGVILSPFVGRKICEWVFSIFSLKNFSFPIPCIYMVITLLGIMLVATLTSAVTGLKVRALKPVEMITEE